MHISRGKKQVTYVKKNLYSRQSFVRKVKLYILHVQLNKKSFDLQ